MPRRSSRTERAQLLLDAHTLAVRGALTVQMAELLHTSRCDLFQCLPSIDGDGDVHLHCSDGQSQVEALPLLAKFILSAQDTDASVALLHCLCGSDGEQRVKLLQQRCGDRKYDAFFYMALKGHLLMLMHAQKMLPPQERRSYLRRTRGISGTTLLHAAVLYGHLNVTAWLLFCVGMSTRTVHKVIELSKCVPSRLSLRVLLHSASLSYGLTGTFFPTHVPRDDGRRVIVTLSRKCIQLWRPSLAPALRYVLPPYCAIPWSRGITVEWHAHSNDVRLFKEGAVPSNGLLDRLAGGNVTGTVFHLRLSFSNADVAYDVFRGIQLLLHTNVGGTEQWAREMQRCVPEHRVSAVVRSTIDDIRALSDIDDLDSTSVSQCTSDSALSVDEEGRCSYAHYEIKKDLSGGGTVNSVSKPDEESAEEGLDKVTQALKKMHVSRETDNTKQDTALWQPNKFSRWSIAGDAATAVQSIQRESESTATQVLSKDGVHVEQETHMNKVVVQEILVASSTASRGATVAQSKEHVCPVCARVFSQRGNLTVHMRIHRGEKRFRCPECSRSFVTKQNLENHRRTHTGEKPFECAECGRRFSRRSNLKRHAKIHSRQKDQEAAEMSPSSSSAAWSCRHCHSTFSTSHDLRSHMASHATSKLSCAQCNKSFVRGGNYVRHATKVHNMSADAARTFVQQHSNRVKEFVEAEMEHARSRQFGMRTPDVSPLRLGGSLPPAPAQVAALAPTTHDEMESMLLQVLHTLPSQDVFKHEEDWMMPIPLPSPSSLLPVSGGSTPLSTPNCQGVSTPTRSNAMRTLASAHQDGSAGLHCDERGSGLLSDFSSDAFPDFDGPMAMPSMQRKPSFSPEFDLFSQPAPDNDDPFDLWHSDGNSLPSLDLHLPFDSTSGPNSQVPFGLVTPPYSDDSSAFF